ncbi:hypothetical protein [Flavobacterium caeni]|uniref:hypothetical protein n=1 Tax=Flavobacterium caeni TaxID=490189 RepID=UPI001B8BCFBC|nr:hypothetical protein [Flavobacterium caeni]
MQKLPATKRNRVKASNRNPGAARSDASTNKRNPFGIKGVGTTIRKQQSRLRFPPAQGGKGRAFSLNQTTIKNKK